MTSFLRAIHRYGRLAPHGEQGASRQTLSLSGGEPRWRDEPNFFGRDYVSGDTSENASPGLASMVSDAQDTILTGLAGGNLQLEEGEYRLTETLDLTRFTGRLGGVGRGASPSYGDPGRGTVFRWDGAAGEPMLRVRDSRDLIIENIRFEGKDGVLPSYGIEFHNNGGTTGSNELMTVRNVHIGRYPWTTQGTNKGDVTSGIGFTGPNANNDQFALDQVSIHNPAEYGIYMPNTQSVGGSIRNLVVYGAGIAGIHAGAFINLDTPQFYYCATDIEMPSTAGGITVTSIVSEHGGKLATVGPNAILSIRGGYVQLDQIIAGGGVLIDASPLNAGSVVLEDVVFTFNTDPTLAKIEFGPVDPTAVGRFFISVKRCFGIEPSQLVFASGASMWASAPMSKGVVEWQSQRDNNIYQFRNELRQSGTGTRTTLDYTAWDAPVTD